MSDRTHNRIRFGIGQLMVAIAIIAFAIALLGPLLTDARVSLPTAMAAHAAGLVIGVGVYFLADRQRQRRMLDSAGEILWNVRIIVRDRPRRPMVDSFAVGVAILAALTGIFEIFQLSAIRDVETNYKPLAGIGGLCGGILFSFAANQRRFPPCDVGNL